jgi:transposase
VNGRVRLGARLNLVERWFAELTNRKLRRSAHRSVTELEADLRQWIKEWNADPKPLVWTKTADQTLDTLAAYCTRINDSGPVLPAVRLDAARRRERPSHPG